MTLTKQDCFNRVWDWFVVQGHQKSYAAVVGCRYRCDDGRRCAAGVLIADEHYQEALEGTRSSDDFVRAALVDSGVARDALRLVGSLQRAHDMAMDGDRFTGEMRERLEGVAKLYSLEIPS